MKGLFRYPFSLYIRRPSVAIATGIALVVNLIIWLWLLINFPPTGDTVFLHYNMLFGVDLIGTWWKLLFMPLSGLGIILVNTLIGWGMAREDSFAGDMLMVIAAVSQVFLFAAMYILVLLNA